MKKITLITASALALGGIGLTTGAHFVHADAATPNVQLQDAKATPSPRLIILDTGEFVNPVHMDPYDYELNNMGVGFETGKVELEYKSKALLSIDAGSPRHFTLKLPTEFDTIAGKNGGADLKAAITAEYKLPGDSDYTSFAPEDIDASQLGLVDFRLSPTQLINMGSVTNIRISINYGKILDSLGQDGSFDYKKIIPDSTAGGYTFSGVMSTAEWINLWPSDAATGTTDGTEAALAGTKP